MKATPFFSLTLDSVELDELEQMAQRNHLSFKSLEMIYRYILGNKYAPYTDVLKYLSRAGIDFTPKTFGKYVAALKTIGDVSVSFEFSTEGYDGRWLVYAPSVLPELCKKRHISLLSFVRMEDIWENFFVDAENYFDFRQKRVKPPETLTAMKARYENIVKQRGHNGTSAKYIRTALDIVVMRVGDMRRIIASCES